jgi:hypothetical protein
MVLEKEIKLKNVKKNPWEGRKKTFTIWKERMKEGREGRERKREERKEGRKEGKKRGRKAGGRKKSKHFQKMVRLALIHGRGRTSSKSHVFSL